MKRIRWNELDSAGRNAALARPTRANAAEIESGVRRIREQVRADGDATLFALTRRFDQAELERLDVADTEFDAAATLLEPSLRGAIDEARERIGTYHRASAPQPLALETAPGVRCERILRPIASVGLYVPAGSAPLPSTALMLGVPAQLAGCPQVVLCTPPRADGSADPAVLYPARACGIRRVFKLGGAQAIAAMAYGTRSVPRCAKVFGPGSAWVTEAKRQVAADPDGAAIDLLAGPSEVLVVADASADPRFVAAVLLAQAEHGPDSQVLAVSDVVSLLDAVATEVSLQLAGLPRREVASQALTASRLVATESIAQCIEVANAYAPEHLIQHLREARRWLDRVESAGSVFLGAWSPESVGDYCSGTNHVLPTDGAARAFSGLSVASFVKQITVQELTPAGLAAIGPCAIALACAERLDAHARAVAIRMEAA